VGNAIGLAWRDQQVDMVGHQHIGMDCTAVFLRRFAQTFQVEAQVLVRKEGRLTVIATLDDMLREPRHIEPWFACHDLLSLDQLSEAF
jgi:hypothetical protein